MRNTAAERERNAARIRAAIEALLIDGPASGPHNVKALADKAGITRSALYSAHYAPLKDEYLRRVEALSFRSRRDDNTTELSKRIKVLEARLRAKEDMAEEFKRFRTLAISRIAGQHEMLLRCRAELRDLREESPDPRPETELAEVFQLNSPLQRNVGKGTPTPQPTHGQRASEVGFGTKPR